MCSEFQSQYVILSKIGEGTFSEVLKCKKISTGNTLAVKKLRKEFKHFSEVKGLPEVFVLEKLPSHPNVLPMIEYMFDSQEGKLFMIFELMDMSLYDMIHARKRCLPENRVKHMFYQLLSGVDHLHANGIFHRDIKPENILIRKSVVKLADLGSIRGTHSQQPYTEYISTRWYRAPECILTAGNYGPKMDIWACGCVFYELLTSKPIFPGSDEIDQLTKIHRVVGTPSPRVVTKLRHKLRLGDVKFSPFPSVNLVMILPFTSDGGRDLLKRMLVYDPDVRINARRLLEHRYFSDLRLAETAESHRTKRLGSTSSALDLLLRNTKPQVYSHQRKKLTGTELVANSWAPSTKTSKVAVSQSKSKPTIRVSPNTTKRKPGLKLNRSPVNSSITKKVPTIRPGAKLLTEQKPLEQKIKTNTMGNLPAVKYTKHLQETKLTKSQIFGLRFNNTRSYLPPIPEQFELLSRKCNNRTNM
uniref:Protein kinase domain-containing protein n=1 Tax=Graphocephala atropunctata TaxID=36148 RepID=A0A1B6KMV8_9HEMI